MALELVRIIDCLGEQLDQHCKVVIPLWAELLLISHLGEIKDVARVLVEEIEIHFAVQLYFDHLRDLVVTTL